MSRKSVCCQEKHTPLSPSKNSIRADWLNELKRDQDIITISHGLFDSASSLAKFKGWRGRLQACDIDPGVREAIEYHGGIKGDSDYPHLNILPPGEDILSTVKEYCAKFGVKKLGAVDVDLAVTIKPCWDILLPILETLFACGFKGQVLLTFKNGRDEFSSLEARAKWVQSHMPGPIFAALKSGTFHTYSSGRTDENARRTKGSAMCLLKLSFS